MSRASNEVAPGPIARNVVENVTRLRKSSNMTREALSAKLVKLGRPIRATGLARLEAGRRRVDADDLVALARALDVSPITLLLPFSAKGRVQLAENGDEVDALAAWDWMRATCPLELPAEREEAVISAVAFQGRAVPMGARSLGSSLTGFHFRNEKREDDEQPLDWTVWEERRDAQRQAET